MNFYKVLLTLSFLQSIIIIKATPCLESNDEIRNVTYNSTNFDSFGCPVLRCNLTCQFDFQKDERGCKICMCNEAPIQCQNVTCYNDCKLGYKYVRSCKTCQCCIILKCFLNIIYLFNLMQIIF